VKTLRVLALDAELGSEAVPDDANAPERARRQPYEGELAPTLTDSLPDAGARAP
jgi:hypothetical protein